MPIAPVISADNLRRVFWLRGVSLVAAVAMALLAKPLFRILPDLAVLLAICGAWALFGGASWVRIKQQHPLRRYELLVHLAADLLLLTLFLAFSGGTANPLTALYLMPVAAAAALLPYALAWAMAATAIACYALLWEVAVPITVEDVDAAMQMHLAGMWLTFGLAAILLVGIVARMSAALRERDQRLAAAREHSLRNERIVALGGLAAGAAHRLGTPLNTLTLLADEIVANASAGGDVSEDAAELRVQIKRCREIVSGLLVDAGVAQASEPVTLAVWLTQILSRFRHLRGDCTPLIEISAELGNRLIRPEATLSQALKDLLDNAADAGPDRVVLHTGVNNDAIVITISDVGKGFSEEALSRVGVEPWTDKPHGMGLGLYLSHATAERLGGTLTCRNTPVGAAVELRIPLLAIT